MVGCDTLLLGAGSMLGWSIWRARGGRRVAGFCNRNTRVLPPEIDHRIDLADEADVRELFTRVSPRLIIHCGGICDVDDCERSPEFAHAVNVEATRHLVRHAPSATRIVYCSSDHVFGAGSRGPYDEHALTAPISVYGRTRVAAEQLVCERAGSLVVRSSLWIGPSATGHIGHLDWLRSRHARGLPMTVVSDEVRSAIWAEDGGRRVWQLADSALTGIRHITATRAVARPELAHFVNRQFAIGAKFACEPRAARRGPHIGNVELGTRFADELARPLPSVVAASDERGDRDR